MYAAERQQAIAELVTRQGRVSVADLAVEFGVTTETVRRDLDGLEERHLLRWVHGGALPPGDVESGSAGVMHPREGQIVLKPSDAAKGGGGA